jgi:hypothetical protein
MSSSVGIATAYELYGRGSIPDRSKRFFFHIVQTSSGVHPGLLSNGYSGPFPLDIKRPGHGADSSSPSSLGIKKSYNFTPKYGFMSMWLIN